MDGKGVEPALNPSAWSALGGAVTVSLTCHSCGRILTADTEDELVDLGQSHAVDHGHDPPPPRGHVLARIRRQNRP